MTPPAVQPAMQMPDERAWRPMTAEEGERLQYQSPVTVLEAATGATHRGVMHSATDDAVNIKLVHGGAIIGFDLDNPDYWPDAEIRERKAPMSDDGEYVLVVLDAPKESGAHLPTLLAASSSYMKLAARVLRTESALSKANHAIQVESSKRELLLAEVATLRQEVEAMRSLFKPARVA